MRRTITALALAVLAVTAGIVTAGPAAAGDGSSGDSRHEVRTSPYVALGDSYSSAAGVLPQVRRAPEACSRSKKNFAHVIARRTHARSFTDVTCSGATTADFFTSQVPGVVAPQLDAVTRRTRLVTMTIGGNDGDAFNSILRGCVGASLASGSKFGNPCEQQFGPKFTKIVEEVAYPNVVKALNAVREKAPRATVVILGYPRAMPEVGIPDCYGVMPISMGDVPYVNQWEDELNGAIEKAAAETGARFIDMAPSSVGHDLCQQPKRRWIEPYVEPINAAPVHPNIAGEAAMAAQTLKQLGIDRGRDHGWSGDDVDQMDAADAGAVVGEQN